MQLLSPEDLKESRQLLGPEESVGRLMTPEYIRLRAEWTCEHALEHVLKYGRDSEVFNLLYVTDSNGLLLIFFACAAHHGASDFVISEMSTTSSSAFRLTTIAKSRWKKSSATMSMRFQW